MKVLLHADVPKLGYFGDVVTVKDGYARNYLLPQRLAVAPTEKMFRISPKNVPDRPSLRRLAREQLEKVAAAVDGAAITIEALANEQGHLFGSVAEAEIAAALQEKAFEIQTKQVALSEHIRMLGTFDIPLRFADDISATVQLTVVTPGGEESDEQAESEIQGDDADDDAEQFED